jgi:hypothetical protein
LLAIGAMHDYTLTAEQLAELRAPHDKREADRIKAAVPAALDEAELALLHAHLKTHIYQAAKAIARWVEDSFGGR